MLSFVAESFVFQFALQKYNIKVKRNVILSLVLYWCEIWSLILRKTQKLWVLESCLTVRLPREIK